MDVRLGEKPRGPLSGVRVLDLSTVVSGPLCGQILGDFGADVIKVETPQGDVARWLAPHQQTTLSGLFVQYNRNKRSVVLDLKREAGRDALLRLARGADAVLENWRPGVAERLGIGYAALARENPRILYLAISGYGPDGPSSAQPAYDMVIQGQAGFAKLLGDDQNPRLISNLVADKITGVTAAYALCAALFARDRSGGRGQRIDVPMLDAFATFVLSDAYAAQTFGAPPPPRAPDGGVYRAWRTADGHVAILVIEDRQFEALCRTLAREDLLGDPRFQGLAARIAHTPELFGILESELPRWTTAELVERAHRFGAPLGAVNGIAEFFESPQVRHNRTAFDLEHPEAGRMRVFRSAPRFAATPPAVHRLPPRLGEHTAEVLREAGLTDREIDDARGLPAGDQGSSSKSE
jgi:crotonobetainyl-CoA:carnitine CoA-transferase CaiB-like acyl-CoA transferase